MDEGAGPETSTFARLEQRLLGGPRQLSLPEVAERLGVPTQRVLALWQVFGLPEDADAKVLTEYDAQVLGLLFEHSDRSMLGSDVAAQLVRSVGHLTDRLVVWQLEALVEHLARRYELDDVSARLLLLDRLADAAPVLQEQLVHAWRQQLVAHMGRMAAQVATARGAPDDARLPLTRAVGFADIVSFTARTAGMTAGELADFVQGFEVRTQDVVSRAGARTVKTIGDAVFFVADDARSGGLVALELARTFDAGSPTPVRVGLVWGHVLARFGDVYGTPVNLAARLTAAAEPGAVLTDEVTAALLAAEPGFRLTPLANQDLPGVGEVRPVLVEAAEVSPGRG